MNVRSWLFGSITRTDLMNRVRGESLLGELIPIAFDRAIDLFLSDLEFSGRSPRTIEFYGECLGHLSDRFPKHDLTDIGPDEIREFFRSRDLSRTSSLDAHYRSFRAFFNWCIRQGYIASHPLVGFQRPHVPQHVRPTLTPTEIRKLLAGQSRHTFLGRRNRLIVRMLFETGMRASELLGLCLDDIDEKNRAVRIRRSKGQKERIVLFGERTRRELRVYLGIDTHPRDKAVHGGRSDMLFLSEERRPLTYHGLREALISMAKIAGITKSVSPHVFRHTWARMMLANGVDSRYVQTLGGWANLEMVRRYTQDQETDDALAAQRAHLLGDQYL